MSTPYDLITITARDLQKFKQKPNESKIGIIINLVFKELPQNLKSHISFTDPYLRPIEGFEDNYVKGYEIVINENKKIEKFVREYIPFFILQKEI